MTLSFTIRISIVCCCIFYFCYLFILDRYDQSEHPIVAQLGGCNKYKMLQAAQILEKSGYDEININCGCPSPKVSVFLYVLIHS